MDVSQQEPQPLPAEAPAPRWPLWLFLAQSVLAVVFLVVLLWAYHYRNDRYLAEFIMEMNNPRLRGRLELGRVHWNASSLIHLAVGTPAPVVVHEFAVRDPRGKRVIHVPRASTRVDLLQLIIGGNLLLHDLRASAGECVVEARAGAAGKGSVVGLVEAFASVKPSSSRGPRVELNGVQLQGIDLTLSFPSWSLRLDGIRARGAFAVTGGLVKDEGLLFDLEARASRGELGIAGVKVPLERVVAREFKVSSKDPMSMWFGATLLAAGSPVRARGRMTNTFRDGTGVELGLESSGAGKLLAHLLGPRVGGEVRVSGAMDGPLTGPLARAEAAGVTLSLADLPRIQKLEGRLAMDFATNVLHADRVKARVAGGGVEASGRWEIGSGQLSGKVRLKDVDGGRFHGLLRGRLDGTVQATGALPGAAPGGRKPLMLVLDLRLAKRPRDYLPSALAVDGTVEVRGDVLGLSGVRVRGDGQTLLARGSVDVVRRKVDMRVVASLPRLGEWLARHRMPALARSGHATLHLSGVFPRLRARGTVEAGDVGHGKLRLRKATAQVVLDGDTLRFLQLRATGLGGQVRGGGTLALFDGNVLRPRRTPLLSASVQAAGLDLVSMGLLAGVKGRMDAQAEVSGPLDGLRGTAGVRFPKLEILGDTYDGSSGRLGLLDDRISIYKETRLGRKAGGTLDLWGDVFRDGALGLHLRAARFPLQGVPYVADLPLDLRGQIDGEMQVLGTLQDPRPAGTLQLASARVRGRDMGSGTITLVAGTDTVQLRGHLLGNILALQGHFVTRPRPRLHLRVDVARFPVEQVLHEIRDVGDVRGLVDGSVRLEVDARDGLSWAKGNIKRMELSLGHRAPGELKPTVVKLVNTRDLLVDFDGRRLDLVTTPFATQVVGRAGKQAEFQLGGELAEGVVAVQLRGVVPVALLQFFLAERVRRLDGRLETNLELRGPLRAPELQGAVRLVGIQARLPGFSMPLEAPSGEIRLVPGSLQVRGVTLRTGASTVAVSGRLDLDGLRLSAGQLSMAGDVNLKLLELLFPRQISHASGVAAIRLTTGGLVTDPKVAGTLSIRRLEMNPRGVGRTLTLTSGRVSFDNYVVRVEEPLEGTYDEGLVQISGGLRHDRLEIVDMDLRVSGTAIPQRQPRVYTAEVNLDVTLLGDSEQMVLQGALELVDVRYVRKFDVFKQAFIKPKVFEEDPPFWKGSRVLETLTLDLDVRSTGQILVKNNIAELALAGDFAISGTLSDPRLNGVVRVDEGTFKLPGLRGDFTINRGEILFQAARPLEDAHVSISSETLFEGRNQLDYQISLKVEGPLSNPGIRLTSSPTLEQGQIWSLLAFGRTTDQLRTELGGGSEGLRSGQQGAAGAADAQVKQLTGEILSQIVEDPLKKVTRLDVISVEVGTESAQIRAGKRLGRYVNLAGEYELGLLGDTRVEGRLEVRMHDLLMLVGKWERLSTRLETEEDDPNRGRIELKLQWPLR